MGVNLDKQIEKQKREEAKIAAREARNSSKVIHWKPKQGANMIRIMPPWTTEGHNADEWCREYYEHWTTVTVNGEEKRRPFVCVQLTEDLDERQVCPLCVEVERLRATRLPENMELANDMRASPKYMSNIVDLDDPVWTQKDYDEAVAAVKARGRDPEEIKFSPGDTKIQLYTFGPMVYKEILDKFGDLRIDLTDFQNGGDILLKRIGKGQYGTKYTATMMPNTGVFTYKGHDIQSMLMDLEKFREPKSLPEMEAAAAGKGLDSNANSAPPAGLPTAEPTDTPALNAPSLEDAAVAQEAAMSLEDELRGAIDEPVS